MGETAQDGGKRALDAEGGGDAAGGPQSEVVAGGAAARKQGARTFLAVELGGSVGEDGELLGMGAKQLFLDPQMREMGTRLWKQMQGSKVDEKELAAQGLSVGDLFSPGLTEAITSSSTPEELATYRKKLEFRADLLEALLEETLAELEHVAQIRPAAGGQGG